MPMIRGFHAFTFLFVPALAFAFASPSAAQTGIGVYDGLDAGEPPPSLLTACTLQPSTIASFSLFWTEPEALTHAAWKIPIASCTACPTGRLLINSVRSRLRWFGACSAQAQVSIVGAAPGPNGCLVPDTNVVVCAPTTRTIARPRTGPGLYTLP